MKTFITVAFTAFLLFLGNSAALFAQQNNDTGSKKITITKRSVDADGTETTETIVKKGKAAENFDVDKYIKENKSDKTQVEVEVEVADQNSDQNGKGCKDNSIWSLGDGISWGNGNGISWNNNKGAFLGVEQDSDEDEDQPGITVQVVKGSAAAKAGLKNNDIILKLNSTDINEWSDLHNTIQDAKPGDQLNIAYSRNGKDATTVATLTKRDAIECDTDEQKRGFLGVNPAGDDDEDAVGVIVNIIGKSAAAKASLRNGDKILKLNDSDIKDWEDISDFMSESNPGDKIQISYERDGKTQTAEATAGEQQEWNWDSWSADNSNWDDLNVNVKEKDACLGVYTETYTQNNTKGTRISGFTEESAANEVQMAEDDIITAVNGAQVKSHNDLWNEISKYQPGAKVNVEYLRGDKTRTVEATLKACRDNSSQVIINNAEGEGRSQNREFYTWNWGTAEKERMRERRIITIHKGEGDTEKVNTAPAQPTTDRSLKLQSFKVYPNPTQGQVTIEFQGESVATVVSLFDLSGRQLFREELNAFNGDYNQQFDLAEYAKGTILIQVVQGEKVYTEQVVVN